MNLPALLSSNAATALSTPPDIPSATFLNILVYLFNINTAAIQTKNKDIGILFE